MFVFRTFVTVLSFYQNQEYITTELCEQRALVINTCNGTCELQKQIIELLDIELENQNINNNKQTVEESFHNLAEDWQFDYERSSRLIVNFTPFTFSVRSIIDEPCTPPPQFS